jgi:hypothetical protein
MITDLSPPSKSANRRYNRGHSKIIIDRMEEQHVEDCQTPKKKSKGKKKSDPKKKIATEERLLDLTTVGATKKT